MGYFIGLVVGIGLIVWGIAGYIGHQNMFNTWNADCNRAGGIISRTKSGILQDRYECFIDNKKVTLPGWEGY